MTLNQIWKNCLRMWKWIAKVWKPGMDVESLKNQWLWKRFPELNVNSNCFFCDYQVSKNGFTLHCFSCPGILVNKRFNCQNKSYHYRHYPRKFYKKLLQLDAKRKNQ